MKNQETTNKPSLHIGMKLYRELRSGEIIEYTISKIGNKYFEVAENKRDKYEKNTLKASETSHFNHQLYLDKQVILDRNELSDLYSKIRTHISFYSHKTNTIEQLREVVKILGIDNESK